ncbi:NADPH-dependent FMN reductase [Trinickia diaoshuihuensis]|uniref:NADPH-dependent FMN reductase n=1 Tax=Trinickia diaoshuihuensis TaxID=2292265 RepID=UPI000E2719EA|nr:NADPH-dependent FMN reductase [Trinickia diaoshuihuensis]
MTILAISGSPSPDSRTQLVLSHVLSLLSQRGQTTDLLVLPTLSSEALLRADTTEPSIENALAKVAGARVIIVGTPIYKAAYTGLLKAFLDLLPQDGFDGKIALPLATGGSLAHLLALDYALRPVLQALGTEAVLPSVFALDREVTRRPEGGAVFEEPLRGRLAAAAQGVASFAERLFTAPYSAANVLHDVADARVAA